MCGIVAMFNPQDQISESNLQKVTLRLNHRGPDAHGYKIYANGRLGIGHTRLSLVDLSSKADQPLEIDNYAISFNGEIYNYKLLQKELLDAGFTFITTSDTEVIIRSVQHWGIDLALTKFNGCFTFILYDKTRKTLYVVRDPLGEKQIVYTQTAHGEWIFASEVKALLTHPDVKKEPDLDRFTEQLMFNMYADPDKTFFKNIQYIPAGNYFIFNILEDTPPKIIKYWDLDQKIVKSYSEKNLEEISDELRSLLADAVQLRMQADCEVGAILSGGLDSSFITVLAASQHSLQAFTAYYNQKQNRDLKNARIVVKNNPEISLNEILSNHDSNYSDLLNITAILEEPLYDKVGIAMERLYREVKNHKLKTVLNGQGSDEQWLGYLFVDPIFSLQYNMYRKKNFGEYWYDSSYFSDYILDPSQILKTKNIIDTTLKKCFFQYECDNHFDTLVRFGLKTHLASIFRMEDKFSMNNSVEVRLPYTDLRLVSLALSLKAKLKMHDKREKYNLRRAAKDILPSEIIKRKKQGFPHPPATYDRIIEKNLNPSKKGRFKIVEEIFKNTNRYKFEQNLPIKERWILKSIDIMEEVYFE
ncbi:MAG: asparagine synthase (glutamine-hydrolyzing) [bacterium]|nr:asparagine synthase (glutamine-hydrolyzing) [bacterium]